MEGPAAPQSICVLGERGSGIPTAALLALKLNQVSSVDLSSCWNDRAHVLGELAEPTVRTLVASAINRDGFRLCDQPEAADAFILAVPDGAWSDCPRSDDTKEVLRPWVEAITPHIEPSTIVVLQSLVPPGTTDGPLRSLLGEMLSNAEAASLRVACTSEPLSCGFRLYDLVSCPRVIGAHANDYNQVAAIYSSFVEGELIEAEPRVAEAANIASRLMLAVRATSAYELFGAAREHRVDAEILLGIIRRTEQRASTKPLRPESILECGLPPIVTTWDAPPGLRLAAACQSAREDLMRRVLSSTRSLLSGLTDPKVVVLAPDSTFKSGTEPFDFAQQLADYLADEVRGCRALVMRLPSATTDPETYTSLLRDWDLLIVLGGPRELASVKPEEIASLMRRQVVLDPFQVLQRGQRVQRGLDWRGTIGAG